MSFRAVQCPIIVILLSRSCSLVLDLCGKCRLVSEWCRICVGVCNVRCMLACVCTKAVQAATAYAADKPEPKATPPATSFFVFFFLLLKFLGLIINNIYISFLYITMYVTINYSFSKDCC